MMNERFVVCVNPDPGIDLETGRIYQRLPDEKANPEDMVRVIDESGEDYLYPSSYFVSVEVADDSVGALEESLRSRSRAAG